MADDRPEGTDPDAAAESGPGDAEPVAKRRRRRRGRRAEAPAPEVGPQTSLSAEIASDSGAAAQVTPRSPGGLAASALALSRRHDRLSRTGVSAVVAALTLAFIVASGAFDTFNLTLLSMGFDTDRAQLITSLVSGGVAAAAAALVAGAWLPGSALGLLGMALLYGSTFVAETQSAAATTGVYGSFSPIGWALTLVSLIVVGLLSGWIGATLGGAIRPFAIEWAGAVSLLVRRRPADRRTRATAAFGVVTLLVLLVTVPVFIDQVNYAIDVHMVQDGPQKVGLGGAGINVKASPAPSGLVSPGPSLSPTQISIATASPAVGSDQPTSTPSPKPSPSPVDPHPWLAWKPSGRGTATSFTVPAPWTGGRATLITVDVYTPPGYDAGSGRRYPVLYSVPWALEFWQRATNLTLATDTLINDGTMPPAILVSIDDGGGPYADPECIDTYDGREWYDRFVAESVVPWVDAHYRTIQTPQARGIMGMSQGGFCAANLMLRHPNLFSAAISFSGYFHAGAPGGNSLLPFGGNQALMDQFSPDVLAAQLDPETRQGLFFVLVAQPEQALYGPEAARFDQLLSSEGYSHLKIDDSNPHGWVQVRSTFPTAMASWAGHMVEQGVFAPP